MIRRTRTSVQTNAVIMARFITASLHRDFIAYTLKIHEVPRFHTVDRVESAKSQVGSSSA